MAKRRPAPSQDEIKAAVDAARDGKGRALAVMVKSFALDDLVRAFSRVGSYGAYAWDTWGSLELALNYASGLKSERERITVIVREARKQGRKSEKARRMAGADASCGCAPGDKWASEAPSKVSEAAP